MSTFASVIVLFAYCTLVLGLTVEEATSPKFISTLEKWWGPSSENENANTDVRPYKIKFTDEFNKIQLNVEIYVEGFLSDLNNPARVDIYMINDLRNRINNRREVTPPLEGVGFQYGFNPNNLDYFMDYWANKYNITEQEEFLNKFPQFKTNIQGLDIHFIRVEPKVPKDVLVLPLLLLHGWPGSVREFYETIPVLTKYNEDRGFAVEVIAPSIPGFGFSDGTTKTGLGQAEMAVVLRNLMSRLGFKQFYVQGGDFGALIANSMVTLYPEEILGYHTNFPISPATGSLITYASGAVSPSLQAQVVDPAVAERMYPLPKILLWLIEESGYLHIQATKPDTLGIGMSDSPMALFSWLMQSVSGGTRRSYKSRVDGGLLDLYTPEMLIDLTMYYWTENKFTTAVRIYAESLNLRNFQMGLSQVPTSVPTCTVHAKDEIIYQSPPMLKVKFRNLLRSTILDSYGHFLALEAPDVFAEDVLKALSEFRAYHESNKTCNHIEL